MSVSHPLLKKLLDICTEQGIPHKKAYLTLEVYLELCEVQKLWQVQHHFNGNLRRFYFTASRLSNSESEVYFPVSTTETISPLEMDELQNNVCGGTESFNLVIKDVDSSCTVYKVTPGLVRPDYLEDNSFKRNNEEKINHEVQFFRNRRRIYTEALRESSSSS